MLTFFWAYVAGTLTLINPCVLPLLPIILAAAFQASRLGPLALATGLVSSFTVVGVTVTAFGHLVGIDEYVINRVAAGLMMAFGVVLLIPQAQNLLAAAATPLANRANAAIDAGGPADGSKQSGLLGQFSIGLLLGAVWSPCVGPTLGGAIGLAASGEGLTQATFIMLAFGIGVSTVLLALAYGSREIISRRREALMAVMPWAKILMGVMLLVVGLMIWFRIDKQIETWLLDIMPIWLQDLSVSV